MYQSTIRILLFFTLFMFHLYGDIENSYKNECSKVVSNSLISRILVEVPEVESCLLNNGSEGVSTDTTIRIIFKQSIDKDIRIVVKDNNGSEVSGATKTLEKSLIFTPSSNLQEDTKYSVSITKNIILNDRANVLYINRFSFKTKQDTIKPIFTSPKSNTVDVNESKKKHAITLKAEDDNRVTYSISGNDSDKFNINTSSGVVTFIQAPDFETKNIYTFTAIATDRAGNEATKDITINILFVRDIIPPEFVSLSMASVNENQKHVITLEAIDENIITYSINYHDSDKFNIEPFTGVVTFKQFPNIQIQKIYTFTATAKDEAGNEATQDITINILDAIPPIFVSENIKNAYENQLNAITLIARDSTRVTYMISGSDFNVDSSSGVVTFKQAPDFETKNIYTFIATAKDEAGNKATQNITIKILEMPPQPVFTSPDTKDVYENQLYVMELMAVVKSSVISYEISSGDSDKFILHPEGKITFIQAPDFETKNIYTFIATAKDEAGNKATQNITINILDVPEPTPEPTPDEIKPKFTSPNQITINENQITINENQLHLITLKVQHDKKVTYEISGGDSDKFTPNTQTGVIIFKKKPNYKIQTIYTFTAKAKDEAGNEATQDIKINIVPEGIKIIWQSNEQAKGEKILNWNKAKEYCFNLDLEGHNNWHLPLKDDLISLVKTIPKKKSNIIKILSGDNWYWSSSTSTATISSNNAWAVDVNSSESNWFGKESNSKYVRCIRPK